MKTSVTAVVKYNSFYDEYYLVIPDDIIEYLQLRAGDTLVWEIHDSKVIVTKKPV